MVDLASIPWQTALFALCTVFFVTLSILFAWDFATAWSTRRQVRKKIDPLRKPGGDVDPVSRDHVKRKGAGDDGGVFERLMEATPVVGDLQLFLEQARVDWTPGMFLVASAGAGTGAGLAVLVLGVRTPGVILAAGLAATVPWMVLRYRKLRRARKFEEEFPEAVDLLARATRAGHPLSAGIAMVGTEGPPVVGEEFAQVADEVRFGLPVDDALLGLADRIDLMDVRIFVTAVLIQREAGGNLAEILDKIGETIRTRFTLRRQLRVYTAQGRLSGYILAVLPIVVAGALYTIDPEYLSVLWIQPVGRALVASALIMQLLGFLWIRRIVNIEF